MGKRGRESANRGGRRRGSWKCMLVDHSIHDAAVARDRDRDIEGGLTSATTTATATTTANM